jgi:iron(III) transport system substrate-binding protein
MNRIGFYVAAAVVAGGLVAAAVLWPKQDGVVVYCALDNEFAQPILSEFEQSTGIHVKPEWDTEQSKTIGLANRLKIEKDSPRCDVFWSNETLQTVRLALDGVFEPYASPSAADIPAEFKDAAGLWTGFAARPRILILTTNKEMWPDDERPKSMADLANPKWKGKAALAQPLSGTTLTHAVVLSTVLGEHAAAKWFQSLHDNRCVFPVGNGPTARAVGLDQAAFGFTDIDDFHAVRRSGKAVDVVYPDQGEGQVGTLLIPNTVALVRGAPHPDLGRKLIDFLLSRDVERRLAECDSAQVPLREDVPRPAHVKTPPRDFRPMKVDWVDAAKHYDERLERLQATWGR